MDKTTFFGSSEVGLKRSNNEDAFYVNQELGFCLVADGMGGAAAGELASRIFVDITKEVFSKAVGRSEKEMIKLVQKAFSFANENIMGHVKENPDHMGMGCTAELLGFSDGGFVLGHMGDSRTYRMRNDQLKQLTQDHSLVQDQINQGLITRAEARNHSLRHVILRAVGTEENLALDLIRGKTYKGDLFLLCTDGLTDMVYDDQIQQVLSSATALPQKVEELMDLAKLAGGNDNITVVLSEIT
jgi:protein phosphatase